MKRYTKALTEALNQPALKQCAMTAAEIKAAIVGISNQLKGPLSNEERLLLVADRSELKATLLSLKQD